MSEFYGWNLRLFVANNADTEDWDAYTMWLLGWNMEMAAACACARHLGYEAGFTNGRVIAGFCEAEQSYCNDMEPVAVVEDSENQRGGHPDGADGVCY